jgi:hypothetical protein
MYRGHVHAQSVTQINRKALQGQQINRKALQGQQINRKALQGQQEAAGYLGCRRMARKKEDMAMRWAVELRLK